MANEEISKDGALTSPEAIRRYGVEAQREADGLSVEPWYEQHQAFKAEQEAEMQRTLDSMYPRTRTATTGGALGV